MATRVRSFSKVNLGLRIGPPRPDGFHGLATVYQTLALCDMVTVSARRLGVLHGPPPPIGSPEGSRITIRTDHPRVPTDARNTAWKMVERALTAMGLIAEVEVRIEKKLPVQGGLGAGSANAAAALIGLEKELGLSGLAGPQEPPAPEQPSLRGGRVLGGAERLQLAAEVGSDVPLFLIGGSVFGVGRGEEVIALPELAGHGHDGRAAEVPCVVAIPRVGVSTPVAFREWDRRQAAGSGGKTSSGLTSANRPNTLDQLSLSLSSSVAYSARLMNQVERAGIDCRNLPQGEPDAEAQGDTVDLAESSLLSLVHAGIENDFEDVVFGFHPSLQTIKQALLGADTSAPAMYSALSGSGSALFGLYRTVQDARMAQQRVQSHAVEAILTSTLPRETFWATMFASGIATAQQASDL